METTWGAADGQWMEAEGGWGPEGSSGVPGDQRTEAQGVGDRGCREEWGLHCTHDKGP